MKVLILGGTGLISRELTRQLADRGARVTIVNRGKSTAAVPKSVEILTCDRHDSPAFTELFQGRVFDAVVDMICLNSEDAKQTIELFQSRCGQIVIVSSVAAYKRPLRSIPTMEDEADLWESPVYSYGFAKAEMERYLAGPIQSGVPITIVRPSLTFGPGSRNFGVLRQNYGVLQRIRDGKKLIMFGDGTNPWSFTFSRDLARMMIGLLGKKETFGQTFHLANQERSNWLDLYLEMGRITGREPHIVYVPSKVLYEADPLIFGHIYYEKSHPGLFDTAKYLSITGDISSCTPLAQGLEELVRSWEEEGLQPDPDMDAVEDKIISRLSGPYRAF